MPEYKRDGHVELTKTEARQAEGSRDNARMLFWGTLGVIVLFALIGFYYFA